jgi:hypothetical protein
VPEYDLHVICPHCQDFHDAYVRVQREETFEVLRVSAVYGKDLPPDFYQAISELRCPNTNKPVNQTDPKMMVLAEVERWSARRKA